LTMQLSRTASGEITGGTVNFLLKFKFPGDVTITGYPLREGNVTTNGPMVINADESSTSFQREGMIDLSTEVTDPALLQRILANPAGFYINLSTSANPTGALRGQLTKFVESQASTVALKPGPVFGQPPSPAPTGTATITVHPTRNVGNGAVIGGTIGFTVLYDFAQSVTITGLVLRGPSGGTSETLIDSGVSSSNPIVSTSGKGVINISLPISPSSSLVGTLVKLLANPNSFSVVLATTTSPTGAISAQLTALAKPLEILYATSYMLSSS